MLIAHSGQQGGKKGQSPEVRGHCYAMPQKSTKKRHHKLKKNTKKRIKLPNHKEKSHEKEVKSSLKVKKIGVKRFKVLYCSSK